MIKYKAPISGWHKTNLETALTMAEWLYKNITTMSGQECINYINNERFEGIKFGLKNHKIIVLEMKGA